MKKTIIYASLAATMVLAACQKSTQKDEKTQADSLKVSVVPVLEKLWESDSVFKVVESALYDPASQTIYVSNIDGEPWGVDGKGSIGKLGIDGKTINAQWVTGLNAPKGLGIVNGKLYVTDVTQLVEIDIATGKISKKYDVPGSVGLNDIVTSGNKVYFSDSEKGVLRLLENGNISILKEGLGGSNGVHIEGDELLVGTWADSSVVKFNPATKAITAFAKGVPQPDGIEAIGDGSYLVSSWSGLIHHVDATGKASLILDTMKDKISTADIDYVADKNILLVPTFFKNSIVAYQIKK
jgi:hypothetical protein